MQLYIKLITDCFKITYRLDKYCKSCSQVKGNLKENKIQSHRNNINHKSMAILSRPRLLKSILTDNETKTEQTESLELCKV